MFGQGFNYGFLGKPPCFTDTTDIFKDNSGEALYTLDYDASDAGGASGKFGESAVLTGTSSQINFPNIPLSAFDAAAVSVSLWVNMQAVVSGYTSGSYVFRGRGNWIIQMISSGIVFQKYDTGPGNNGNNDLSYNFSGGTNLNQWYHIVVTDNGTSTSGLNLYVDGVLRDSNSGYANIDDNSWLAGIANYAGRAGGNFKVDQLRIFNKELLASEVTTLYNETKNTTNTLQILGDTSCIATYTFDGSSTDLSGNYNGTDTNILYRYDGTPTAVDFGVGGKSLYGARFNGSSSKIDTNFVSNLTSASYSFWVNIDSGTNGRIISSVSANPIQDSQVNVTLLTNGDLQFAVQAGGAFVSGTASGAINYGTWYHIALTYSSGGSLKGYINGTEVSSVSIGTVSAGSNTTPLSVGFYPRFGTYELPMSFDQLRIFSKALSQTEVSKLYGNGAGEIACTYTSTTDNIALPITNTAYYKLDNNSKDSAKSRGKFNQGATFVGNSAGIVNTTLQLSSTAHSVSLWMKPQDLTATKWQIMFFSAFNGYPSFTLGKRPDQTTSFHYRNESSNEVYFTLSNANTWYHVVVTRNNSGSTIYVNGSSVATDSNSMGTYSSSAYQKASIGSNPNYPAEYFDGTLDQIRVYDVALTSTDVANLYNSETTSTTNTLAFPTGKTAIATYTLDGNGVDVSGNYSGDEGDNIVYAYDGTWNGTEQYAFGRYGQAAKFTNDSTSWIDLLTTSTSVFSCSVWVKLDELGTTAQYIIGNSIEPSHPNDKNFNLYYRGDTNLNKFSFQSSEGYVGFGPTIQANRWYHVAWSGNNGALTKVWVDGQEQSLPTVTQTFDANGEWRVGVWRYRNSSNTLLSAHPLRGLVDQVRIYDAALTSSQVTQLYNEKPEVDTSNFKTVLYEGNGGTQYVSNVGFESDLVWIKKRSGGTARDHMLYDSIRGAGNRLRSNQTYAASDATDELTSFDANGFTSGSSDSTNGNNYPYVAWVWKGGGLLNKSASFNGSSSKIDLGNNSSNNSSVISVSLWFKTAGHSGTATLINNGGANSGETGYFLGLNSNGTIKFEAGTGTVNGTVNYADSNWHQIVLTLNSGAYNIYVDGNTTPVITGSGAFTTTATRPTWIGQFSYTASNLEFFNGSIDQVRVFNKAISAAEVTTLYNETASTINTLQVLGDTSCVATYPLGTGAGDLGNTYSGTASNVIFNNPGHLTRNNNGTIESTVSANTDAGFSIVKWTGDATSSPTVGHGLNQEPEIYFLKGLDNGTDSWIVCGNSTIFSSPTTNYLRLNTGASVGSTTANAVGSNGNVINVGVRTYNGQETIAYCFHSVDGSSKIGSYNGNGSSNGPFIHTGFKPAWLMVKWTNDPNSNSSWVIYDNARNPINPVDTSLRANNNSIDSTASTRDFLFLSNGFKADGTSGTINDSSGNYIYMAFK